MKFLIYPALDEDSLAELQTVARVNFNSRRKRTGALYSAPVSSARLAKLRMVMPMLPRVATLAPVDLNISSLQDLVA